MVDTCLQLYDHHIFMTTKLNGVICQALRKPQPTKTDEFSEKFQRGGGSFSFILQIFAILNGTRSWILEKICNMILMKRLFGTFPKIHLFWKGSASLTQSDFRRWLQKRYKYNLSMTIRLWRIEENKVRFQMFKKMLGIINAEKNNFDRVDENITECNENWCKNHHRW